MILSVYNEGIANIKGPPKIWRSFCVLDFVTRVFTY